MESKSLSGPLQTVEVVPVSKKVKTQASCLPWVAKVSGFLNQNWLYVGIALIALASMYDAWLVFEYREVIDEQNAFCRWLISLEPEYVSIFLLGKLTGTALVSLALAMLVKYWRRIAVPAVTAVVAFQVGLMCYLHTYDSVAAKQHRVRQEYRLQLEDRLAMASEDPIQSAILEEMNLVKSGMGSIQAKPPRSFRRKNVPPFIRSRRRMASQYGRKGGHPPKRPARVDKMAHRVN